MNWQIALIIMAVMILQAVLLAFFFVLGLSHKEVKSYVAQRMWIRNFKAAGRIPEGIDGAVSEVPEDEDEKEREKKENEDRGFYA